MTRLLLEAVSRAAGLPESHVGAAALATKLQLWGAALPINTWDSGSGEPFAFSRRDRIGICGDWLGMAAPASETASGVPSTLESAWLSGRRLAEHLHLASESAATDVGLTFGREGGSFVPVDAGGFADTRGGADWVKPPQESSDKPRSRSPPSRAPSQAGGAQPSHARLFVRNLPYASTEAELAEHIRQTAQLADDAVASVQVLRDPNGKPKGLARVEMHSVEAAAAAIRAADGSALNGRPLRVATDERAPAAPRRRVAAQGQGR